MLFISPMGVDQRDLQDREEASGKGPVVAAVERGEAHRVVAVAPQAVPRGAGWLAAAESSTRALRARPARRGSDATSRVGQGDARDSSPAPAVREM